MGTVPTVKPPPPDQVMRPSLKIKRTRNALSLNASQRLALHATLIVLAIPFVLPLVFMVSTSLKGDKEIYATGAAGTYFSLQTLIPKETAWNNYPKALEAAPFGTYLGNTLFLCVMNVIGAVLSSAVAAYGFARIRFRGRGVLFVLMISTMALPAQVTMIPVFAMYRGLGWYGSFLPLVVPLFFGMPFYIFLMTQFFKTIPEELAEAARIDGASEFRIFTQIALPLAKPALATCALFQFLWTWNDYFGPLLYLNNPSRYTLAYGLQQFLSSYGGMWAQLMAGATIFTVPIIILFFLAQKTFIQGIATTGTKG